MARQKKTDLIPADEPVASRSLKKATEAIFIRPVPGSRLTLLKRKAYNVLLHNAQEVGDASSYRIALRAVMEDMRFDSNDMDMVKDTIRSFISTQVEWDVMNEVGRKKWGVSALLAEAEIEDGVLEYSFAPKIRKRLLDPEVFHRISIQMMALFRSQYALALYEICGRYRDNPGGVTMRAPWEKWRELLCGEDATKWQEFKIFNRDVIKRGAKEVNEISDIRIEPVYFKQGRSISDIQFKVMRAPQSKLALGDSNYLKSPLYKTLIDWGMQTQEARDLILNHDEAYLASQIRYVEERVRKDPSKIGNKVAYLKGAIKGNYAKKETKALSAPGKAKAAADAMEHLRAQFQEGRMKDARDMFGEAPEVEQNNWVERFELEVVSQNAALAQELKKRGMASKMVQGSFYAWLADTTWGPVSEGELLRFAVENGLIGITKR
jgi:hypothetical protein